MSQNSQNIICQNCKNDFGITPDDFPFYKKIGVDLPTFCPACRIQRRFASRNERFLYKRNCDLCEKNTITIYHSDEDMVVYCNDCWWSDGWDPSSFSRDYDFTRNFFEQYSEWKKTVPHEALYQSNFVNSDYANFGFNFKSCYLVSGGWDNERVYFATQVSNTTDSYDILFGTKLELCYNSVQCARSSSLRFCLACEDSSDLYLSIDCRGCVSCVGCVGLRNKMYCIFNKQYSKEDYERIVSGLDLGSYRTFLDLEQKLKDLYLSLPLRFARFKNTVDCTGDNINDSKNAKNCFSVSGVENVKNGLFLEKQKDSMDTSYIGKGGEEIYEVISSFGGSRQVVGVRTLFCCDSFYSEDCHNCNDIFACIGLKKKSYAVFNKEYSKEEYEKIRDEIIRQMKDMPYIDKVGRSYTFGDFWPIELESFCYNETKAQEHFSLTKSEALNNGYRWRDKESSNYVVTVEGENLPDSVNGIDDSMTEAVIGCLHKNTCNHNCTHAFRVLKTELEFYKRMNLPLPRLCPNCRHANRITKASPFELHQRKCMCDKETHSHGEKHCEIEFETSYSLDSPEIVYCEKCYQQEVY